MTTTETPTGKRTEWSGDTPLFRPEIVPYEKINYLAIMDDVGQSDTKKAVLEALEAKYGIVTEACRYVGLPRSTYYEWVKNDPEFKAAVDEIQETAIDFVEGQLFQKINGVEVQSGVDKDGEPIIYSLPPSDTAIIFYLKTKAKKRGYIERNEVAPVDPDGNPLKQELTIKIVRDTASSITPGDFTPQSAEGSESGEKV